MLHGSVKSDMNLVIFVTNLQSKIFALFVLYFKKPQVEKLCDTALWRQSKNLYMLACLPEPLEGAKSNLEFSLVGIRAGLGCRLPWASDSLLIPNKTMGWAATSLKEGLLLLLHLLFLLLLLQFLLQDFAGVLEAGQPFTRGSGWAGRDWPIPRLKKNSQGTNISTNHIPYD